MNMDVREINHTLDTHTPVYVIEASPPSAGIYAKLLPRYQVWNDGAIAAYYDKDDADKYKHECDKDRNGWKYEVRLIGLPHATRGNGWRLLYDRIMDQHIQTNER